MLSDGFPYQREKDDCALIRGICLQDMDTPEMNPTTAVAVLENKLVEYVLAALPCLRKRTHDSTRKRNMNSARRQLESAIEVSKRPAELGGELLLAPSDSSQQSNWVSCARWMTNGQNFDLGTCTPLQINLGNAKMPTVTALGKVA